MLLGMENRQIAMALAPFGFTQADTKEGWALLQGLGQGKIGLTPIAPANLETIELLDAWENRWFPIADASLARHYPAVHARFFLNLSQTAGPEVAVSVKAFIDRYDALTAPDSPYGPDGVKAQALLQMRGIAPSVVDEARGFLDSLGNFAPPEPPPSPEEVKAKLAAAEDAVWGWYLEWSQVSRTAIKQRALLRQLGFLSDSSSSDDTAEPVTPPVAPAAPAALNHA
jgi:hypothetical protein